MVSTSNFLSVSSAIKFLILLTYILCTLAAPVPLRRQQPSNSDHDHGCRYATDRCVKPTPVALLDRVPIIHYPSSLALSSSLPERRNIFDIIDLAHNGEINNAGTGDTDTDETDETNLANPITNQAGAVQTGIDGSSNDTDSSSQTVSAPLFDLPSLTLPAASSAGDTTPASDNAHGDDSDVIWLDDLCVCDEVCNGSCECDEEDYTVWTCNYVANENDGSCVWEPSP